MLIIAREVNESISLDPSGQEFKTDTGITITVLEVQRGQVRLGITAPQSCAIERTEIVERRHEDRMRDGAGRVA